MGFGGLLNLCRDPEDEIKASDQRPESEPKKGTKKRELRQTESPKSPKSGKKSQDKTETKLAVEPSKKSILKRDLRPVNDSKPSSKLLELLSSKAMIEKGSRDPSQDMEEEQIEESPKKKSKKASKSKKSPEKTQTIQAKSVIQPEEEDSEDDIEVEEDHGGLMNLEEDFEDEGEITRFTGAGD